MRDAMGEAALRLARGLGYASAGTVEFLVDDESGEFFFLEVNTRLQVEHPVTEEVTGIDLVRAQILVAEGHPLENCQDEIYFEGSAIEARLYAENPANDFLPAIGRLTAFEIPVSPAVRWDTGVREGTEVGTDFDPMLAKVIGYGPTREEAAGRLALALERLHLGGVVTNRDFLVATLRSEEFLAGDTTTDFIDRIAPARTFELSDLDFEFAARIAALWIQGMNRANAQVLRSAPTGWRNSRMPFENVRLAAGERECDVRYRNTRDGGFLFDDGTSARVFAWSGESIDVEIGGRRRASYVTRSEEQGGEQLVVQTTGGDVEFSCIPRFKIPGEDLPSGGLVAQMPGKVIELRVAVGDHVEPGQTLLLLEAMKMEHPMQAVEKGVVSEIRVEVGEQVENGALLLFVETEGGDESSKDA